MSSYGVKDMVDTYTSMPLVSCSAKGFSISMAAVTYGTVLSFILEIEMIGKCSTKVGYTLLTHLHKLLYVETRQEPDKIFVLVEGEKGGQSR